LLVAARGDETLTGADAWVNGKDPGAANRKIDPDELKGLAKLMDETEKEKGAAERKGEQEASHLPEPSAGAVPPKKDASRVAELGVREDDSDKEEEGGGYVRVIDDPEEPKPEDWVQEVAGEEEEDAGLRREMLNYNMQEIGAVVAEINLEEDGDYYGYEDSSDEDPEDNDEESEEEDKYGRTTRRVVTESYRKEMEELQRRMLTREGKLPPEEKPVPGKKKAAEKKGVRFAEELDIAPSAGPGLAARLPTQPVEAPPGQTDIAPDENNALPFIAELLERQMVNAGPIPPKPIPLATTGPESVEKPKPKEKVSLFKKEKLSRAPSSLRNEIIAETPAGKEVEAPVREEVALSESVLERTPGASTIPVQAPNMPSKKISRFKASKMAKPEGGDEEEPDKPQLTMSNFIVEHDPATLVAGAKPPDELDPDLHRQEVAANFHRLRTKMIQQQGGFIESDEDRAIVPLNEDGGRQKISRFKAARLKGLGA